MCSRHQKKTFSNEYDLHHCYEGLNIDQFLDVLGASGIERLVDIRELPISRKPGFAKTKLSNALASMSISYSHFGKLGSPKSLRHAVRNDGDYSTFFGALNKYYQEESLTHDLAEVLGLAKHQKICLMCFCEDWQHCHRRAVIDALSSMKRLHFSHLRTNKADTKRKAA